MTLHAYQVFLSENFAYILLLEKNYKIRYDDDCFSQTLYESSIAFGIRKALQAEQGEALLALFIFSLRNNWILSANQ